MRRSNLLLISLFFSVASCTPQKFESLSLITNEMKRHEIKFNSKHIDTEYKIGQRISGDFDGSGFVGYAQAQIIKQGTGNPIADETTTASEYAIIFANKNIPYLPTGCCDLTLVYEGDLDGDGADEISVLRAPMNGCMYYWTTYTFKNREWKALFEGFFCRQISCDNWIGDQEFIDMVFLEDGVIYYNEFDFSEENFGTINKVKAILK